MPMVTLGTMVTNVTGTIVFLPLLTLLHKYQRAYGCCDYPSY